MKKGNTNSPWFPNVLKPGSTTSSPWFPDVYGNADKIVKKSIGKPTVIGGPKDKDGDGVPNYKDCQPENTMRQDAITREGMTRITSNIQRREDRVMTRNLPKI